MHYMYSGDTNENALNAPSLTRGPSALSGDSEIPLTTPQDESYPRPGLKSLLSPKGSKGERLQTSTLTAIQGSPPKTSNNSGYESQDVRPSTSRSSRSSLLRTDTNLSRSSSHYSTLELIKKYEAMSASVSDIGASIKTHRQEIPHSQSQVTSVSLFANKDDDDYINTDQSHSPITDLNFIPTTTTYSIAQRHGLSNVMDISSPNSQVSKRHGEAINLAPSSLKEGFKSMFGLFGRRRDTDFKAIRYRPRDIIPGSENSQASEACSLPSTEPEPLLTSPSFTFVPQAPITGDGDVRRQTTTKSGLLHYLCPEDVWSPARVTVQGQTITIVLTTSVKKEAISMHSVSLELMRILDVRSLSSREADAFPFVGSERHIFEIELSNGRKEYLATISVSERGSWVSLIWDAKLNAGKNHWSESDCADLTSNGDFVRSFENIPAVRNVLRVVNGTYVSSGGSTSEISSMKPSKNSERLLSFQKFFSPPTSFLTASGSLPSMGTVPTHLVNERLDIMKDPVTQSHQGQLKTRRQMSFSLHQNSPPDVHVLREYDTAPSDSNSSNAWKEAPRSTAPHPFEHSVSETATPILNNVTQCSVTSARANVACTDNLSSLVNGDIQDPSKQYTMSKFGDACRTYPRSQVDGQHDEHAYHQCSDQASGILSGSITQAIIARLDRLENSATTSHNSAASKAQFDKLHNLLSQVSSKLEVSPAQEKPLPPLINLDDVTSRIDEIHDLVQKSVIAPSEPRPIEAKALHDKMEVLIEALDKRADQPEGKAAEDTITMSNEKPASHAVHEGKQVKEIADFFKRYEEQTNLLTKQQTDSVRYLHELNAWLENVLKNATNSMNGVVTNVERLACALLDGHAGEGCKDGCADTASQGLITQLRHSINQDGERDEHVLRLEATVQEVHKLVVDRTPTTDVTMFKNVVWTLLEQQQEQYRTLLTTLADQLTNEIRGERIRFIESMKEATSINVTKHVEDLKGLMAREVHGVTREVARLQRERQTIEHQLSELFDLLSKQRRLVLPHQQVGPDAQHKVTRNSNRHVKPEPHLNEPEHHIN